MNISTFWFVDDEIKPLLKIETQSYKFILGHFMEAKNQSAPAILQQHKLNPINENSLSILQVDDFALDVCEQKNHEDPQKDEVDLNPEIIKENQGKNQNKLEDKDSQPSEGNLDLQISYKRSSILRRRRNQHDQQQQQMQESEMEIKPVEVGNSDVLQKKSDALSLFFGQQSQKKQKTLKERMVSPIQDNMKQKFTLKINQGFFQTQIAMGMKGYSGEPLEYREENCCSRQRLILFQGEMVGRLQKNLMGTVFNVFNENNRMVATICYVTSMSFLANPRNVQIYISEKGIEGEQDLKEKYKKNKGNQISKITMPEPTIEGDQCMIPLGPSVVALPSIHNAVFFQGKRIVMKFYKSKETEYLLRMKRPFSPLIGYCYVLSSFLFKLISQ